MSYEMGFLHQAMINYIYALEGKPPPNDKLLIGIAGEIRVFAEHRLTGQGIPSRDDSAYKAK